MPDQPPDFHSTVPEINQHHETLQRANELETRPPSPEPETTETLIDVGSILNADHGFGELNADEFQAGGVTATHFYVVQFSNFVAMRCVAFLHPCSKFMGSLIL